jgi:predicted metal-dependent hydrolase
MASNRIKTLIAGKPASYRVRRSRRAKRAMLMVDGWDGLVVVLPLRAPRQEGERLLAEHAAWVAQQLERYGVQRGPVRRQYASGSEILFLGRQRRLQIEPLPEGQRRARLRLRGDVLQAILPPVDILDPRPALERWLRAQARRHILTRVRELGDEIGLQPDRVIVGERRTRWGSCSGRRTLSFCYRLVMAPLEVMDAVIVHEICHLRHMNHGPRFQRLLRLAMPDHNERMAWLKRHEEDLRL